VGGSLPTWFSICGLGLDFAGAAFLAYDVLYGPKVRRQVAMRRTELAVATQNKKQHERSIQTLSASRGNAEDSVQRLREELPALIDAVTESSAELSHWEKHARRAQQKAFVGLLLLMAGFACQATGIVLSGRLLS
jgi:hypothetical protein